MDIIHPSIKIVSSLIGKQKVNSAMKYRDSFFCLQVSIDGGLLLYNSLTGEVLLLDDQEKGMIENDSNTRKELISRWFLVPEDFNEKQHCDQIRKIARTISQEDKSIVFYTIFTTTVCNARCFYCFEIGQRKITMNRQTSLDVAKWIVDHSCGKKVFIRWFGGEPLCNYDAIDTICNSLRANQISYQSTIVTNAFLFDRKLIQKSIESWNLQHATVTLDGTEDVYNQTKAFVCKENSPYQRVMSNIKNLLEADISVTIRLNMDAENVDNLKELTHELGEYFRNNSNLGVRCEILKEYTGKIHNFNNGLEAYVNRENINQILESVGIKQKRTINDRLALNACMADSPRSAVVLPDGRIGRCEHYGDSHEVGSVYSDIINEEEMSAWRELWPSQRECESCVCYPLCFRLKRCSYFDEKCDDLFRIIQKDELMDKVKNTYYKWKNERKEYGT